MLGAAAEVIARDLTEFGEDDVARWIARCTDDELVRVCSVANWRLFHGPTAPSGSSMMISKATALAAVYVSEGHQRNLARARRKALPQPTEAEREQLRHGRFPPYEQQASKPKDYGVGDDAREFWGAD